MPDLFSFSSTISGDEIIIFGGMFGNYTQSKDLWNLQLEDKRITFTRQKKASVGFEHLLTKSGSIKSTPFTSLRNSSKESGSLTVT
jgi:hypothetical protein